MPSRIRSRSLKLTSGGKYEVYNPITGYVLFDSPGYVGTTRFEETADSTTPSPHYVDTDFTSRDIGVDDSGPLKMSGEGPYYLPPWRYRFMGYAITSRSHYANCPLGSALSPAYWKTKALANMNPNTPRVDIPLFLFELREFPRMLRDLGRVLSNRAKPSDVPGGYLAYSFGWGPLVSDVLSLFDLTKSINDRIQYLKRLERRSRIRRQLGTFSLGQTKQVDVVNFYTSPELFVRADAMVEEKQTWWYTANASLANPLPTADAELRSLSRDILLGLQLSPASVWNAIPWTWLIDYFVNTGDIVEAQRGWISFKCTRLCLMCTQVVESNLTNMQTGTNTSVSGGNYKLSAKHRFAYVNPTPQLSWDPFLTNGQLANLGALIAAKALRAFGR